MPKVSEMFPSRYLKSSDLNGREAKLKISYLQDEDIGGESKHVLYFVGKQKGLVLNKTNARVIGQAYGDDSDGWGEMEVVLYPTMVEFRGTATESIRVKIPPRTGRMLARDEQNPPPVTSAPAPFEDQIQF